MASQNTLLREKVQRLKRKLHDLGHPDSSDDEFENEPPTYHVVNWSDPKIGRLSDVQISLNSWADTFTSDARRPKKSKLFPHKVKNGLWIAEKGSAFSLRFCIAGLDVFEILKLIHKIFAL